MTPASSSSPLSRLPRAAVVYGIGDVVGRGINLLVLPVLTRTLTPSEFGIVVGVTAYAQVVSLIMQLNLSASLLRFQDDSPDADGRQRVISTLVWFNLAWVGLVTLTLMWFAPTALDNVFRRVPFDPYLELGTWWAALMALTALPLAAIQAKQRPAAHRLITIAGALTGAAIALTLVVAWSWGALGSIAGQTCGAALTVLLLGLYLRADVRLEMSSQILWQCLLFSLPLAVYSIGGWLMDQSNRMIIEKYLTLQDLGIYGVAFQIGQLVTLALTAVGTALMPLFYEQMKHSDGAHKLARFGVFYLAATISLVLAVTGFAREIVGTLTGSGYSSAWLLVAPLALTQSLNAVWQLVMPPLLLRRRTGVLAVAMLISAAVSIALSLWLVPRFGIAGAALAPLGANLLLNAIVFRVSIRELPVPYPFVKIGGMIALGLAWGIVINILSGSAGWMTIAARALLVVAYPLILIAFGVLPFRDVRQAWRAAT